MTEQNYDDIIAPMLADVARKCAELGMNMIARVEWQPGESGITRIGDLSSIGQRLTTYAALAHGNIDAVCLALLRECDVSRSIFLASYTAGKPEATA